MSFLPRAFALTLLTALPITGWSSCTGTWKTTANNGEWNDSSNWTGCIPGSSSTTDVAILPIGAVTTVISLDTAPFSPTLGELSLDDNYVINGTFPDGISFNGASASLLVTAGTNTINARIVNTSTNLTITNDGILNFLQSLSCINSASSIIHTGSGTLSIQAEFQTDGSFTLSSGNVSMANAAPSSGVGLIMDIEGESGGSAVTVNGGVLTIQNTGTISGTGAGSRLETGNFSTATFSLAGGQVIVDNGGSVSGAGSEAAGVFSNGASITGGTMALSNSMPVSGSDCSGSLFEIGSTPTANLTMSGGVLTNTNTASISAGNFGCMLSVELPGNFNLQGGLVQNTNMNSSGGGIGALVQANAINISGGTFTNNDRIQANQVNISSGGTLAGTGLYQGYTGGATAAISNSGLVIIGDPSIGGPPGIMTVQGSYTQTASGVLAINLLNTSSFSQLIVTGPVTLGGSLEVALSPGASVSVGDTFEIIQGHPVTGTFANVINFNLGSLMPLVEYFPTYVLLTFAGGLSGVRYVNYFEPIFSSVNHTNLRLDRQMAQLRKRFPVPSMQAAQPANTAFIPDHTGPHVGLKETEGLLAQLIVDNNPADVSNPQVEEKQEQLREAVTAPVREYPWNVYFGPTGDVGHVMTKGHSTGYDYWTAGALAGFDYAFSQVGAGLLVNYDHIHGRGAHQWGEFNINQVHASLYTTYAPPSLPELAVNGIMGGGYQWYSVRRNITFTTGVAQGKPSGGEFDALLGLEYAFEHRQFDRMPKCLQLVPLASLQYIYLTAGSYHEHNAGMFDLAFKSQMAQSLRSTLGARLNYTWTCKNAVFTPEINLAWQREYLDPNRLVKFSSSGTGASLQLPQSGRNVALAGIDFLVTLFDRYGIEASYDFEWNSLYRDHFFYVGADFRF